MSKNWIHRIFLLTFASLVISLSGAAKGAEIDVYLLGGQSNAAGRGVVSEVSPSSILYNTDVMLYHSSSIISGEPANTWTTLRPAPQYSGSFGPECGFGNRMAALTSNRQVAIIKHAVGATSLSHDWWPGANASDTGSFGPQYTTFVNTVTGGMNALIAQGYTPVIKAMLWQQGEKDANSEHYSESLVYDQNLSHFISRLRDDFNAPDMFFVYGQVLPVPLGSFPYRDNVRQGQLNVDQDSGHQYATDGAFVVNTDAMDMNGDNLHLSADGQLDLGTSFADTIPLVSTSPPTWDSDPVIESNATEGVDYSSTLADDATDPAGGSLVFSKLTGPSWLDIAADGTLSGVPDNPAAEAGVNSFTIRATADNGAYADAGLQIAVENTFTGELGLADFADFAFHWLDSGCVDSPPCGGADLTGEGAVDIDDLKAFAWMWLIDYDLISVWPFDADASDVISGHDGTLVNGASINTTDPAAVDAGAVELDGVNDYVEVGDDVALNPNTDSWSTSFWLKSDTASQGAMVISKRADSAPFAQYSIGLSAGDSYYWDAGSKITFLFREATGIEKGGYTTSDIDISDWTHVAVVLDRTAGTVYVYIDGVSVPVTLDYDDALPTIINNGPLYIGGNPSAADLFQGMIDEVRIYNRALSPAEIAAIAQ